MKIYVASSWKNPSFDEFVRLLQLNGFHVFNFKEPGCDTKAFNWRQVLDAENSPDYLTTPDEFNSVCAQQLVVQRAFQVDSSAVQSCDVLILLLPCGSSAHLEAGFAAGCGKPVLIFSTLKTFHPELMYNWADLVTGDMKVLFFYLRDLQLKFTDYFRKEEDLNVKFT